MDPDDRTLDEILQTLSTAQLMFVAERPWHKSHKEAAEAIGISPGSVSNWDNKADVQRAVDLMVQDGVRVSQALFRRHLPKAAMELVNELSHRSVMVRHRGAKEILDRGGVVASRNIDLTSGGKELLPIADLVAALRAADTDLSDDEE